jgi:hypothetical protein
MSCKLCEKICGLSGRAKLLLAVPILLFLVSMWFCYKAHVGG